MSSPANAGSEGSSFKPFTKAERIQQLNDIDKSITQLLQSAGLALKTLSATRSPSDPPPPDRREAFEAASNLYLKTLQSIDVGLHRQIYGLEEAGIIPAEKAEKPKKAGEGKASTAAESAGADVANMGKLDIGWLNSRSGRVGRDMEAELWERARGFLEGLENGAGEKKDQDGDQDMGT